MSLAVGQVISMSNNRPLSSLERVLAACCHLSIFSWLAVVAIWWYQLIILMRNWKLSNTEFSVVLWSLVLPLVIAVIIWLCIDNRYLFAKRAIVEVINVHISLLIYLLVNSLLAVIALFIYSGLVIMTPIFLIIPLLIPMMVLAAFLATFLALGGQEFRYPLIIRLMESP
jgi:uncharacterized Tic20 family protein